MKKVLNFCLMGLCILLASPSVFAAVCQESIEVSNPWDALSNDQWQSNCESVSRVDNSDPYNPKPALANYYTFTLDRDADVRIQLDPEYNNYNRRFNLIEGNSAYDNIIVSNQYRTLETRLVAGTYTLETNYLYGSSFTYQVAFNDTAINNECTQAISTGTPISDGWISACESTSRDILDPYNTIQGEGHRTKYFTFSLQDDTDIRIDVDSTVNTYIYILSGTGEFAVPYEDFNSEIVTTSLPQGDYTIEVTTYERYAPGQFSIELNTYNNAGGCSQDLNLGSMISGSWSADCEIRSWLDENGDPYQGDGPERANYYRFTLAEATEVRFRLAGQNESNTIFSLYESGNYLDKLATTQSSYWGSPSSEFSIRLEPGSYELEVTKYNEVAIGNYTISSFVFENDECANPIVLGVTEEAYLASDCESLFRIVDGGMDDPYGAQPGTYYAKRFEFTLDAPSTVMMNANTNSQSGYLYLAKRINGQLQQLTESWTENSWNTTSSPFIYRTLDAGRYVMEVTSYYPEREGPITANVRISSGTPCETFLALNTRTSGTLAYNSNCKSEFKSSYYNYDPYGPNNGYQDYYARSYTFEIEQAGTYSIVGSSFSFATDIRLVQGGDVKGQLLTEQSNSGENTINRYLEPGFYTVEVTSLVAGDTGSYSILVWDGSSEIGGGVNTNECIQTLPFGETAFSLFGTWAAGCESANRSGSFAKYYDFNVAGNTHAGIAIDLSSTTDTYLYLLQWNGSSWVTINSDDDGGSGSNGTNSRILSTLQAGLYRIEATTFSSASQADFQLLLNIEYQHSGSDSDGDGIADTDDEFPNDASEWLDTDGDGIGNNADLDKDNDGIPDYLDALPLNNESYLDSDSDGISDELDGSPYPPAGDIRFVVKHLQVIENENKAIITIERVGEPFLDANIFYYTEDDSAVANKDYKPSSGKLEFDAYVDTHTIEVELINDESYSGDRSFFIKMALPFASAFGSNSHMAFPFNFVSNSQGLVAEITIADDDTQPTAGIISFSASILSVNESDATAQVEITRSVDALGEAVVAISTMDSTAFASSDYEALSEVVVFSEGELTKTLSIPIINNEIFEGKETLLVGLTSLTAGVITRENTLKITIIDDDALPEAGEISLVINEMIIPEKTGEVVFTLQRSSGAIGEVEVHWAVADNAIIAGIELQSRSGDVVFAEGETHKSITLNLIKESIQFDGLSNEICINLLLASSDAYMSDKQFCLILEETDLPPASGFTTFSGTSYQVIEGNTATITLNRLFSSDVAEDMSIYVYTDSIQAKSDLDFIKYNQKINLSRDEMSTSIAIESINDDEFEGTESYSVSIENEGVIQTAPVYIKDDESEPSEGGLFRFSGSQYTSNGAEGTVSIVVQRVFGFSGEELIAINMIDGTAKSGDDYDGQTKLLQFSDGEKSKTIEIDVHAELKSHDEKSFSISLYSATNNLLLAPSAALITIKHTDQSPENGSKKKDKDKGFLGLGLLSPWWMLLMLLPACLVRIRRVEA
jgi:hypothetical protein